MTSNRSLQIFLALFSLLLFLAGIGSSSILTQGDESDYIRTSQEMYQSGDLLTPTLRQEPRFTKPPLLYWMVVSSYELLGVSFFSARLPTVICAVLTVIFVFRTGLLLFDRRGAWISAVLTATSFGMVKFSKIVLMESPLILTMLLAYYYFLRFYREKSNAMLILSFVFLGISGLLKSPVYSAIGAATLVVFLLSEKSLRRLACREFLLACVIALLISVPWYLTMISLHGSLFTDFYLKEHINKFEAVPHFILRVWIGLLLYMLPWVFYVIYAAITVGVRRLYRQWQYRLLLIVMGVFLLVFMIPNQKGLYYSIPLLPYCGLMTGGIMAAYPPPRICDILTALVLVLAALVFAASIFLLQSAVVFAVLACVFATTAAVLVLRPQTRTIAMLVAAMSLIPLYTHLFPSINFPIIPVQPALKLAGPKPLYSYKLSPLKFENALDHPVIELTGEQQLRTTLANGGLVIITESDYHQLRSGPGPSPSERLSWPRWQRRIPFEKVVDAAVNGQPENLHETVYLISG